MKIEELYTSEEITQKAKSLFKQERSLMRLDGWFLAKEKEREVAEKYAHLPLEIQRAEILREIVKSIPLEISADAIFVGTQRDAFARTYALINPTFKVEEFSGYCDPTAIFSDIAPDGAEITQERINQSRNFMLQTPYVKQLNKTYSEAQDYTGEVIFFFEQVTGHIIPDFRRALKDGVNTLIAECQKHSSDIYKAMEISLDCVKILAQRYSEIANLQKQNATELEAKRLSLMIATLEKISGQGAENLYEAIQLFMLLWQLMCLEQAPNPFAFSVGNADRIFQPYIKNTSRADASALFKHFLVFFNVGDRSWAISQNIILGGRDVAGNDLSSETTYALLDAYFDMNLPQPILSIKLHKNTPDKLYAELGKFFFTAGMLTPSLFNDDAMFEVLTRAGIDEADLPDYSIAGCQEPLIMGKDNGNTTNSWLNLPKVLEMVLTGGYSNITGKHLVDIPQAKLENIREDFYKTLDNVCDIMAKHANEASLALSNLRVPFLSAFMGGIENGADMRDPQKQGTKYNGSGCLIHGLTVLADSFVAIDAYLKEFPNQQQRLLDALKNNFEGYEDIRAFLKAQPKFGNNIKVVDDEATDIAKRVCDIVRSKKNYLGNNFRPDLSSPSTHLLYGYWVGATPDGRSSREMINYGVDPLFGESCNGLGFRMLSNMKLPFGEFNGGYASHLGIDPKFFTSATTEEKGLDFKKRIVQPLFFNQHAKDVSPFYLYVNVVTPEILRKVLANPKKYAPSGVYIMRIHGTFVNFLDLSPAIQNDIITRLDLQSTTLC